MPSGPIKIVCAKCGGISVCRDATVRWDVLQQDWTLSGVQDQGYCDDCNGEARLKEVPLTAEEALRAIRGPGG